jgi:hypothetical protein
MSIEAWKFDANLLDSHSSEIAAAFSLDVGSSKIVTNCGTNFTQHSHGIRLNKFAIILLEASFVIFLSALRP